MRRRLSAVGRSRDRLGGAGGEERSRPDRSVEGRPNLARGQLFLEPVEASQPAAEVVDHVHERRLARARHDRTPVLEAAVVGEDDVQNLAGQLRREAIDLLDLPAHQ